MVWSDPALGTWSVRSRMRGERAGSADCGVRERSAGGLLVVTDVAEIGRVVTMGNQDVRQDARRRAQEVLGAHQARRIEQERRLRDQAIVVLTMIGERDRVVADLEVRAGEAIRAMLADGLRLNEAAAWCAGISVKEIARLSRLAPDPDSGGEMAS